MAKLNSLGVRAVEIDRIFADAIERIAEGEEEFSCCAIGKLDQYQYARAGNSLKVRRLYVDTLAPKGDCKPNLDLLNLVTKHVGCAWSDKSQGFRILMLSLVKAAWRDLV